MKQVPLNVVIALVILLLAGSVFFAWVVLEFESGERNFGETAEVLHDIARLPQTIEQAFVETASHPGLALEQRFGDDSGFKSIDPGFRDPGYLLLSRVHPDLPNPRVDLIELTGGRVVHSWSPDIDLINKRSRLESKFVKLQRDKNSKRYRIVHPFLTGEGGLIFQDDSPLVKINACSKLEWTIDRVFHHSLERGPEGNFWLPSIIEPSSLNDDRLKRHRDESIIQVSPDGNILFEKSVAQILIDNGYRGLVFGVAPNESDILHLNEAQPALTDGRYWQRGDLLISIRYRSTIFLYRPSTNKILWLSIGPWLNQHDPDFINDSEIAVFSNESYRPGPKGRQKMFNDHNEVYIIHLGDGSVRKPFSKGLKEKEFRTISEGRSEILANGDLYIEESNHGRLARLSRSGELRWQYINRASDGKTYKMGWSRYLPADLADPIIERLTGINCDAQ